MKEAVLESIAGGTSWRPAGRAKFQLGGRIVHVRFCSSNKSNRTQYKFNINPNTLTADYELWICGGENQYYLIPKRVIQGIYNDPDAYIDHHHPEIRVVSVDLARHEAMYAPEGKSINLERFFQVTLYEEQDRRHA